MILIGVQNGKSELISREALEEKEGWIGRSGAERTRVGLAREHHLRPSQPD